jgi:hypothetical protein
MRVAERRSGSWPTRRQNDRGGNGGPLPTGRTSAGPTSVRRVSYVPLSMPRSGSSARTPGRWSASSRLRLRRRWSVDRELKKKGEPFSSPSSAQGFAPAKANTGTTSIRTRIQTTKAALNMEPSSYQDTHYRRLLSKSNLLGACRCERDLNHKIAVCQLHASSRFQ